MSFPLSFPPWPDGNDRSGKMGFKIRRRDIPPEKHPADMDSSREIDLVVKLSVLLWNDDMGSDQFKEVVHDQLRDDFMADILRLF